MLQTINHRPVHMNWNFAIGCVACKLIRSGLYFAYTTYSSPNHGQELARRVVFSISCKNQINVACHTEDLLVSGLWLCKSSWRRLTKGHLWASSALPHVCGSCMIIVSSSKQSTKYFSQGDNIWCLEDMRLVPQYDFVTVGSRSWCFYGIFHWLWIASLFLIKPFFKNLSLRSRNIKFI